RASLGVALLELRHPSPHAVAGKRARDEHDQFAVAGHAATAVGEAVYGQFQPLVSYQRRHRHLVYGRDRPPPLPRPARAADGPGRPRLLNEPDHARRSELHRRRCEVTERDLNPTLTQVVERDRELTQQRGAGSVLELYERFGYHPRDLHAKTSAFLERTEA